MIEDDLESWRFRAEAWERLFRDSDKSVNKYAEECGRLMAKLSYAEYRLEKARREFAQQTGIYNPRWPEMDTWEIIQSYEENPQYILPIPTEADENKEEDEDILSLFLQSSNSDLKAI